MTLRERFKHIRHYETMNGGFWPDIKKRYFRSLKPDIFYQSERGKYRVKSRKWGSRLRMQIARDRHENRNLYYPEKYDNENRAYGNHPQKAFQ